MADIKPIDVLEAVRPFEVAKNHEKARRTLEFVGRVFRFAVSSQIVTSDPTRDLRGALTSHKPKHLAAILDPKRVGELLRPIDGYEGMGVTAIALKLSPMFSCDRASCARRNGARLILKLPSGGSTPPK